MLATPVTNAPASPSSQGHLSHESLLETESADGVNVFARESKVFDVELEILLTRQAIVVPVQTVEADVGEPALVVDSVASTDADVASALHRVPPTEVDVISSVDSRSSPDIGPQLTKPTTVAGSGPNSVTTPSYERSRVVVPSYTPDAEGLASFEHTSPHAIENSKLVIGNTPSANQSAQDPQAAGVLTKSTATSGGSDEGIEDLGQEPEVAQINRPGKSRSKVAAGVESTSGSRISSAEESSAPNLNVNPTPSVETASYQVNTAGHQNAPTAHSNSATTETSAFDVRSVSMSSQIVDHVLSARQSVQDGKVQLEVTLDPPELGKITIELTEVDNQLSARLLVSENATLDAIRSLLPSMIDSLTEAGLSLDDLHLESSAGDNHASDGDAETGADASHQSKGPDRQGPASHWNGVRPKGVDILA